MTIETQSEPRGTAAPRALAEDEISVWEVLATLIRRRWTIALISLAVSALAVSTGFIGGDDFTTEAAFSPQGSELGGSELLALASQFGVNVGGGAPDEASPAFYGELLMSRAILSRVASESYRVDGVGQTTLVDLLEIEEETPELDHEEVIEWLETAAVSVTTAATTGTVSLAVVTGWPDLSRDIASNLLEEVTRFNMDTRQSRAAAERTFIEARVDSATAELRTAEDDLQAFLEGNRQWEGSPDLRFRHDRFQREVMMKQSVLTTLVQSFEQARISEVRDTPVITVIQEPFLPPGPDSRRFVLRAAVGLLFGLTLGTVAALMQNAFARPAAGDPAREDFQRSWEGFVSSIPLVGGGRARPAPSDARRTERAGPEP